MQGLLGWFDGKKTHLGMMLTGAIGVASMFGLVSGITPEAGADMLQSSLAIIGGRSAAPKLILMAVQMYVKSKQG